MLEARLATGWRSRAIAFAVLLLLVGAAYGNSIQNGFVYDDVALIQKNTAIRSVEAFPNLFLQDYWASLSEGGEKGKVLTGRLYRPFTLLTYGINYSWGGLDPVGYHLANLLLHFVVCWLVFLLGTQLLKLSFEAALIAGGLFAVHPLLTESVAGVVGRAEILMALGTLAALGCAAKGRTWTALLAFCMGLFAKEQAVMFPAVLLLYDLYFPLELRTQEASFLERIARRYGPYVVVLLAYLAMRVAVIGASKPPVNFIVNPLIVEPWFTQLLTLLKVWGMYLWLFIWPASLSADYSYHSIPVTRTLLDPWVWLSLLAWGSLGITAVAGKARLVGPRLAFCAGFVLLTFLPTSNIFVFVPLMAERFFYLPTAGICWLVAVTWDDAMVGARASARSESPGSQGFCKARGFALSRILGIAVLFSVGSALLFQTNKRIRDWRDDETLFLSVLEVFPQNAKAYANLGHAWTQGGRLKAALDAYQTALRIYPEYTSRDVAFATNYGTLLLRLGNTERALEVFQQAQAMWPRWSRTHYNLGLTYARRRNWQKAEQSLRQALTFNDQSPDTYNALSRLFIETGRYGEALVMAENALQHDPELIWALFNRAWALEQLGRFREAARGYEEVLRRDPGLSEVRRRLERLRKRKR